MLKVVKEKNYQQRGKMTNQRFKLLPECPARMAALISGHPLQKSIAIHFHPCNPVLLPQNICSFLFFETFLSILSVYLVAFCNKMRKLEKKKFL